MTPASAPAIPELRTPRLRLRGWTDDDRRPYAEMNADPVVMEHFPNPLTAEQSDAHVDHVLTHWERHGCGLWAVEITGLQAFIGFVGLSIPTFEADFMPCVEVGWRLTRAAWGHGYATEGARAALAFGFGTLGIPEIVSFTTTQNTRSRRVMEKLGMTHDPADDFDHPRTPGWSGQRHVLYRLSSEAWHDYGSAP